LFPFHSYYPEEILSLSLKSSLPLIIFLNLKGFWGFGEQYVTERTKKPLRSACFHHRILLAASFKNPTNASSSITGLSGRAAALQHLANALSMRPGSGLRVHGSVDDINDVWS